MHRGKYFVFVVIIALLTVMQYAFATEDDLSKYVTELDHKVARFTCSYYYEGNFTYILDSTPIVELNAQVDGFHTVDDVIVVKVPKNVVQNKDDYARGIVRTLYKNGLIRILPGIVFVRVPEDGNNIYFVIPVIHKYGWVSSLSRIVGKSESYTILVTYAPMDYNFTIRVHNPPCNGVFCRSPLTDKYALWFSDADANPIKEYNKDLAVRDDSILVVFGGIYYMIYNGGFMYDERSYAGSSPLFDTFLFDKSPTLHNLYAEYLKDKTDMAAATSLYNAQVECLSELFGNYYYEHSKRSTFGIPIAKDIYSVDVIDDSSNLDKTWCLDQLSMETLDDPTTGYTAAYVVGKLDDPTETINLSTSKSTDALCILTNMIEANVEQEEQTGVEIVEGSIPIKNPVVKVYSEPRASKKNKAWVRVDLYNPNDFAINVAVDFKIIGGVPAKDYNTHQEITLNQREGASASLIIDYLTASEANVIITITATAPRINPDYNFNTKQYVTIHADYYGIESFCIDENRLAKVSDNAVKQIIYCSDVDAKCYDLAPTYAECRANKPYEFEAQLDMMYKDMYGGTDPTKEFLLFGGTGATSAVLDAIGSAVGLGSIANALRSLTFWETLIGSLMAVGVSYYIYKSMPNNCRLKPIVAVLAPIIGLAGGSMGLLLTTGIAWILCVAGGKQMKY